MRTDSENLTALLMAGAGDCLGKGGTLNCSKLADYLIEHGVIVLPCKVGDTVFTTYNGSLSVYRVTGFILNDSQTIYGQNFTIQENTSLF